MPSPPARLSPAEVEAARQRRLASMAERERQGNPFSPKTLPSSKCSNAKPGPTTSASRICWNVVANAAAVGVEENSQKFHWKYSGLHTPLLS